MEGIHAPVPHEVSVSAEVTCSVSILSFDLYLADGTAAAGRKVFPFLFLPGLSHVPLHSCISYVSMITPFPNSKNTNAFTGCHPVEAFYVEKGL